jgi:hypothetical protein
MNGAPFSEITVPSVVSSHSNEQRGPDNVSSELFLEKLISVFSSLIQYLLFATPP